MDRFSRMFPERSLAGKLQQLVRARVRVRVMPADVALARAKWTKMPNDTHTVLLSLGFLQTTGPIRMRDHSALSRGSCPAYTGT